MRRFSRIVENTGNEKGVALLTVLMLLLILTVLGVAGITISGLENRGAGLVRMSETAAAAAESCLGTSVSLITQAIDQSQLPAATYEPNPIPAGNSSILAAEILGFPLPAGALNPPGPGARSENYVDEPEGTAPSPNLVINLNAFAVNGDIDRLQVKGKAGGAMQMFAGYEGTGQGAGSGGTEVYYRINCVATNAATGSRSRVTGVYACVPTGDGCVKKL